MKENIKKILRNPLTESKEMYKAVEIQAPHKLKLQHHYKTIFLAGSIEMGKAIEWQGKIIKAVPDMPYIFFNPRRDDWDSTWKQEISDKNFNEQVNWELEALEVADVIIMYFDPKTQSPISLLELGLHARSNKLIVVCPDGFWKKGNVDVTCKMYKIKQVDSLEDLIDILKEGKVKEFLKK